MTARIETHSRGRPVVPPLRPTWTTWMWLGFAVAVAALTVIGMLLATRVPG